MTTWRDYENDNEGYDMWGDPGRARDWFSAWLPEPGMPRGARVNYTYDHDGPRRAHNEPAEGFPNPGSNICAICNWHIADWPERLRCPECQLLMQDFDCTCSCRCVPRHDWAFTLDGRRDLDYDPNIRHRNPAPDRPWEGYDPDRNMERVVGLDAPTWDEWGHLGLEPVRVGSSDSEYTEWSVAATRERLLDEVANLGFPLRGWERNDLEGVGYTRAEIDAVFPEMEYFVAPGERALAEYLRYEPTVTCRFCNRGVRSYLIIDDRETGPGYWFCPDCGKPVDITPEPASNGPVTYSDMNECQCRCRCAELDKSSSSSTSSPLDFAHREQRRVGWPLSSWRDLIPLFEQPVGQTRADLDALAELLAQEDVREFVERLPRFQSRYTNSGLPLVLEARLRRLDPAERRRWLYDENIPGRIYDIDDMPSEASEPGFNLAGGIRVDNILRDSPSLQRNARGVTPPLEHARSHLNGLDWYGTNFQEDEVEEVWLHGALPPRRDRREEVDDEQDLLQTREMSDGYPDDDDDDDDAMT